MTLKSSCVGYYKFEESSGNFVDAVGNQDASNTGSDYQQTGKIDYGISMAGGSDYLLFGDQSNFEFGSNWSVSVWLKFTSTAAQQIFTLDSGGSDRAYLCYVYNGKIAMTVWNADASTSSIANGGSDVSDDTYHHFVWVYNEGYVYGYVDGALCCSQEVNSGTSTKSVTSTCYVGRKVAGEYYGGD